MNGESRLKWLLLGGLVLSTAWLLFVRQGKGVEVWIWWAIWPAMALHQCEENIFTELALGRKYSFLRWVRTVGYAITPGRAALLNVGVGWTLALLSGACGARWPVVPLFVIGVETVNAFWHISVTSLQQRWSPGTLTSAVVTIPLGAALFHYALVQGLVSAVSAGMIFLAAVCSHHVFLGSLPRADRAGAEDAGE